MSLARDDRGAATVLAVVFIGLLTSVAVAVVAAGGLVSGHRRAASAADLAALAGAAALQKGSPGCVAAEEVAEANRSRLLTCQIDGEVLTVEVGVDVESLLDSSWTLTGRARAGPSTYGAS